ncbi:AAA family ATPase [Candidatus Marsarchaeota G2 archaeon BE_D]|jgi:predicted AAA+ superfamily ATPase|uniref:AAA family ATPase n=5 Tax=Candidatus Marsarchaeota TaxID=1978152 RepID=A0A2R6C8G0_9ARCH|nr:MAG: AAA family ATPase [Candidatus Marsarchaeota G1 archaeon OSP_D]PSN93367.1 MAG: AAA family ATPase [Candidatus Marsarchaeota G2 archaeon ECH_B_2]PSN97569.1 MAG: AAA family ATPase [Candidatus Marsarchaeota G2 archaeon ECH_B_3]PSN99157.1 MAG: AAA family ATPase [Candidatus Marsarchaeota G2 archaeon ECH_B_1]PSO07130.1 MAG: AAA family ATPase [Candidatus Marsarchaeota G2 archaeon BE_D]
MENLFRQVVSEWLVSNPPRLVRRDERYYLGESAYAVIGPRRAGKTFFMFQIASDLLDAGWDRRSVLYINFEDVRFSALKPEHFGGFLKVIHEYGRERDGKIVLLLDEVQNIPSWGKWVRSLLDRRKYHVVLSGSSSKVGVREIPTELRGRYLDKLLLPFSFKEFLKFKGLNPRYYEAPEVGGQVLSALREYMQSGGFPEVVLNPERASALIDSYRQTVVYRDVIERHKIRDAASLELFMDLLGENFGKQFSITKITNYFGSLGLKKSKKTIANYLKALEDAFYVISVKRFGYNKREVLQQPSKVYPIDVGYFVRDEIGQKMEALVAVTLFKCAREHNLEIHYLNTEEGEVDFVVSEKTRVKELLQVTYTSSMSDIQKREIKSVVDASLLLKPGKVTIVTWDLEDEVKNNVKIRFVPLWKWLLGQSESR